MWLVQTLLFLQFGMTVVLLTVGGCGAQRNILLWSRVKTFLLSIVRVRRLAKISVGKG